MSGPPPSQPPPGWNDPPTFSAAGAPPTAGTGLKLNKRVGFPTASGQAPEIAHKDINTKIHDAGASAVGAAMPPPPPMMTPGALPATKAPPPMEKVPFVSGKEESAPDASTYDVESVVSNLEAVLEKQQGIDQRKAADIKKRIGAMATKWKAGSLNQQVESGMGRIAAALEAGDGVKAEEIQVKLMIDWPAVCSPWLVGIKHLITTVKEAQEKDTKNDDSGNATPQIPLRKVE